MKSRMMKWLGRGAFAALVAGVMLAVGPQYAVADFCDQPEQLGTCPPYTNDAGENNCCDACVLAGYSWGGFCVAGCCTCFTK
jgi:hypothetical protein